MFLRSEGDVNVSFALREVHCVLTCSLLCTQIMLAYHVLVSYLECGRHVCEPVLWWLFLNNAPHNGFQIMHTNNSILVTVQRCGVVCKCTMFSLLTTEVEICCKPHQARPHSLPETEDGLFRLEQRPPPPSSSPSPPSPSSLSPSLSSPAPAAAATCPDEQWAPSALPSCPSSPPSPQHQQ